MTSSLAVYAGKSALREIKQNGLSAEQIVMMAGASGGPKWFTLFGLDKYIFGEFFKDRQKPLYTIGSSAGAWRMACFAQKDPVAAITKLAKYYSQETYSKKPTAEEVSQKASLLVDKLLGEFGAKEIVENSIIQTHLIVARARGITKFENKYLQLAGLISSATLNAISEKTLPWFFERYNFYSQNESSEFDSPYFQYNKNQTKYAPLNEDNIKDVLLASGSIPLILKGVTEIDGVRKGVYRDGGVIDYHFNINFPKKGLVLYPHFHPIVKTGWFDKGLKYRHANPNNFDNVVMIMPSESHIKALPYGKISDRSDLEKLDSVERIKYWQIVLSESERVADDFGQLIESGKNINKIIPIETIL